jgi:hypothetical protein
MTPLSHSMTFSIFSHKFVDVAENLMLMALPTEIVDLMIISITCPLPASPSSASEVEPEPGAPTARATERSRARRRACLP